MASSGENPAAQQTSESSKVVSSSPAARTVSVVRDLGSERYAGRSRILLVAPDRKAAQEQEFFLAEYCDVEMVESIELAVQTLVCDRNFRLVLCPAALPEGSANMLLRQLIDLDLVGCPRIVVYEGSEDPSEVVEALQLGVRQYIAGPCSPSALAKKIARLVGIMGTSLTVLP